jgi:hypothetical protein
VYVALDVTHTLPESDGKIVQFQLKLATLKGGASRKGISFNIVPLDPALKSRVKVHLPVKRSASFYLFDRSILLLLDHRAVLVKQCVKPFLFLSSQFIGGLQTSLICFYKVQILKQYFRFI